MKTSDNQTPANFDSLTGDIEVQHENLLMTIEELV